MQSILYRVFKVNYSDLWTIDVLNVANIRKWDDGLGLGYYQHEKLGRLEVKTVTYHDILRKLVKALVIEKSEYSIENESNILTHSDSLDVKPTYKHSHNYFLAQRTIKDQVFHLKEDNLFSDSDPKMSHGILESNTRTNKTDKTTNIMDSALSIVSKSHSNSTTQINNRPIGNIYRYTRILKIGIFIVFLINLITCFSLYVVVDQEAVANIQGAEVLKSFIKMRSMLVEFGIHAKEMYLIDSGVITHIERQETTDKLMEYIDVAEDIIKDLGSDNLNTDIRDMIYSTHNTWWYYDSHKFYDKDIQLVDNLYYIMNLLLDLINLEAVEEDNVTFLEIIRNCPAETRLTCLDTVNKAFSMQTDAIDEFENNIKAVIMSILLFTLGLQIVILSVIYFNFNKLRYEIWSKIFEITQNNLFYTATCIKERLGYFNRDESEFNIQPSKLKCVHKYVQHKFQKLAYLLSSMFVVITLVTLLYIYYFSLPVTAERLHNDLKYVQSVTNERNRVIYIYYLLREAYSPASLLENNRYNHDINTLIKESNEMLITIHQETIEMTWDLSPEIEELYLNAQVGIFSKGLHSAILDYRMMIYDCMEKLNDSSTEDEFILVTLDDVTDSILDALDDLGALIKSRSEDMIKEGIWYTLVYCISSNIALFIFIMVVLFPSVIKIKETIQKEIKIWKYLSLYDK